MKIFLYQQYKGKETNYKDFLVPTVLRNRNKLWNINGRGGGGCFTKELDDDEL
jgi:hypothetical protein